MSWTLYSSVPLVFFFSECFFTKFLRSFLNCFRSSSLMFRLYDMLSFFFSSGIYFKRSIFGTTFFATGEIGRASCRERVEMWGHEGEVVRRCSSELRSRDT